MNTPQPDTSTLAGKIAVMQAAMEGKRIQFRRWKLASFSDWTDIPVADWTWGTYDYRIHPEDLNPPKWRAWEAEEVPIGALLKCGNHGNVVILGLKYNQAVQYTANDNTITSLTFTTLINNQTDYQVSLDNGKTWQPCGVRE